MDQEHIYHYKMNSTDPRGKSSHYYKQKSNRFINKQFEFVPTQFIIDENYVGSPPKVQISFENLNDNIDENFLRKDLLKLGKIRTIEIVRHPETKQHLGLAKVQFEDPKVAQCCADTYNGKQLMGKQLSVYQDIRFAIIERRKEDKLKPQPVVNIETPKPQIPLPQLPVLTPLHFPPLQVSQQPQIEIPRSINRQHTSLDDRLAKLGLKQVGTFPSIPPQVFSPLDKSPALQQFNQNHIVNRHEIKIEKPLLPPAPPTIRTEEEEEKAWNPEPSPVKETLHLTNEQIAKEVLPYCYDKFLQELQRCVLTTLRRRLIQTYGYPCIEKAQTEFMAEQHRLELQEQENRSKSKLEDKYFSKDRIKNSYIYEKQRANLQRTRTFHPNPMNRNRFSDVDLRRKNRSSAAVGELPRTESRHTSIDSRSDGSSCRQSRSPKRLSSASRSSSSGSSSSYSRSSSSSSSSSSVTSSSSSASSRSSSPPYSSASSSSSRLRELSPLEVVKQEKIDHAKSSHSNVDLEAAETLSFLCHSGPRNIIDDVDEKPIIKTVTKKRKNKEVEQENHITKITKKVKKLKKEDVDDDTIAAKEEKKKPCVFKPLDAATIERMINDLSTISEEDVGYLEKIHSELEEQNQSNNRVPFGTTNANKAHIILPLSNIKSEIESKNHPKWWKGCSRCSAIDLGDKGKLEEEEMNYEDLTKAPIKSHVIQAANSTRRDQRSDQRRIAALNPEIDKSFLKHFTSNTLQMRAKNLRFSRSKIHKWGLFACEKIANGDAVIEYVGEKIRPTVADHRENIVYPNLPTHDGSSYFFRVDTDVIDATLKGNKARFINHSCNPNCIAKVIKHENGTNSIVIYAKQTINEDEEITYDYKFPREEGEDKIQCNCKAPNCQKFLN